MATERIGSDEATPQTKSEVKYPHTLIQRTPKIVSTIEFGLPGNPESYLALTTDKNDNPVLEKRVRFLDENGNSIQEKLRRDEYGPARPIEFKENEVIEARRWFFEYRNNFPEIYHGRSCAINALPEPEFIDSNLEIVEQQMGIKPLE